MFLANFNPYLFLIFVWAIYLFNSLYLNYKMRCLFPKKREEILTFPVYFFLFFLGKKIASYFWGIRSNEIITSPPTLIGILFCLVAITLFIYLVYFEKNFPSCETIKKTKTLQGIYNYIRHPSYTVIFLLFFGSAFVLQDIFLFFWAFITHIFLYFFYIAEERRILKEYPHYREYLKKTNRFLPRFSKIRENIFSDSIKKNKTI